MSKAKKNGSQAAPVSETPECDKVAELHPKMETIRDFLVWLGTKYVIAVWAKDEWGEDRLVPIPLCHEDLIADHFGIDQKKREDELRALLKKQRELYERQEKGKSS